MRILACFGLLVAALGALAQPINEAQIPVFVESLQSAFDKYTKSINGRQQPFAMPEGYVLYQTLLELESGQSESEIFEIHVESSENDDGPGEGGFYTVMIAKSIPGHLERITAIRESFCEDVTNDQFRDADDIASRQTEILDEDLDWQASYFRARIDEMSDAEIVRVSDKMYEIMAGTTYSYMDELSFAADDPELYEWFKVSNCRTFLMRLNDPAAYEAMTQGAD